MSCLTYYSIKKGKNKKTFSFTPSTVKSSFDGKPWADIMKECGFDYTVVSPYSVGRGYYTGKDENEYLSQLEYTIGDILRRMKNKGLIRDYE